MSLLICCTGIVLVSLFSAPDQADIKPNTTFTDNLVDVHPDAVEEGKNRGSVLGYIVSVFSLYFIIWRFGAGRNRGSLLGYIVSMFAPVSFCAPHVNLCSNLTPAS